MSTNDTESQLQPLCTSCGGSRCSSECEPCLHGDTCGSRCMDDLCRGGEVHYDCEHCGGTGREPERSEVALKTFPPTTHTVIGMDADSSGRYARYRARCSCGWVSKSVGKSSIGVAADQLRDHVSTLRERQRVVAWIRDVAIACGRSTDIAAAYEESVVEQVADGIENGEHLGAGNAG